MSDGLKILMICDESAPDLAAHVGDVVHRYCGDVHIDVTDLQAASDLNPYDGVFVFGGALSDRPHLKHDHVFQFQIPVRAGALLKTLDHLRGMAAHDDVVFGPYRLDLGRFMLRHQKGDDVKLTEKEATLLQVLAQANGKTVLRDDLLKSVWGYRDGLDTHTLETHIYRLRQKIEVNPSEPVYLLTRADGYSLSRIT